MTWGVEIAKKKKGGGGGDSRPCVRYCSARYAGLLLELAARL